MRSRFEDDDAALDMALSGLEDEARAHRLGDRMPEGHRSALVITISPGGDMPPEEMTDPNEEEEDEAY